MQKRNIYIFLAIYFMQIVWHLKHEITNITRKNTGF